MNDLYNSENADFSANIFAALCLISSSGCLATPIAVPSRVLAGGLPPFLGIRRHKPNGQPRLVDDIGNSPQFRCTLQPAALWILLCEFLKSPFQRSVKGVDAGRVSCLIVEDDGLLFVFCQSGHFTCLLL